MSGWFTYISFLLLTWTVVKVFWYCLNRFLQLVALSSDHGMHNVNQCITEHSHPHLCILNSCCRTSTNRPRLGWGVWKVMFLTHNNLLMIYLFVLFLATSQLFLQAPRLDIHITTAFISAIDSLLTASHLHVPTCALTPMKSVLNAVSTVDPQSLISCCQGVWVVIWAMTQLMLKDRRLLGWTLKYVFSSSLCDFQDYIWLLMIITSPTLKPKLHRSSMPYKVSYLVSAPDTFTISQGEPHPNHHHCIQHGCCLQR